MNHIKPRRIAAQCRFGRYRRLQRPHVRFYCGILGILRISGKRKESDGRENGERRDYDYELYERESKNSTERSFFKCRIPMQEVFFSVHRVTRYDIVLLRAQSNLC